MRTAGDGAGAPASSCDAAAWGRASAQDVDVSRRPRRARSALLLVDFINPLDFTDDPLFVRRALRAARAAAQLKARLKANKVPVVYANDHWGKWTQSLDALVGALVRSKLPGRELSEVLAPEPDDFAILKPRHSAFYGTPLDFLLEELTIDSLTIAGIAADNCVLFTASDAYLRKFKLWIPANCVVAERDEYRRAALAHMKRVLKAHIVAV
jgi:nicotinamidase-related amidase